MGPQTLVGAATKTVLVADETEFVRNRFRTALSSAGYRVLLAGSRSELIARIHEARDDINLVVLDVRLSACDAAALIRQLHKLLPQRPPIVAFSGTVGSAAAVKALEKLSVTAFLNEYTSEHNIVRALHPFLCGSEAARRTSPRVPIATAITFRVGQTIVTAVTLNIGRGGLAVRSTNPFPQGTIVRLRMRVPTARNEVEAEARVAWSDPRTGMGLQFSKITPEHLAAIDEFVTGHFFVNRKG